MNLILLAVWHSIIATIIFLNPTSTKLRSIEPTNIYVYVDRYVFICLFCVYVIIQIAFLM